MRRRFAARRLQRAYRRYRGRYRTQTMRLSAPNARQTTRQLAAESSSDVGQKILNYYAVRFPLIGLGPGFRLGTTVNLRGIRIWELFENNSTFSVECHWALVQPKDPDVPLSNNDVLKNKFFRNADEELTPDRAINFVDGVAYAQTHRTNYINPDKFHILHHRRWVLDPKMRQPDPNGPPPEAGDDYPLKQARHTKQIDRYFRFNKIMNFNDGGDTVPNKPILILFWQLPIDAANFDVNLMRSVTISRQVTIYYKPGWNQ